MSRGGGGDAIRAEASAQLIDLSLSVSAPLVPSFAPTLVAYQMDVTVLASEVMLTPTALEPSASIRVNGEAVTSGAPSSAMALDLGNNAIVIDVTVGAESMRYEVVITRAAHVLAQVQYGKASNTDADDWFGCSVSVSGDTLAVGAYGEASNATSANGNQADNSAHDSGAVYVFRRTGDVWAQEAYLKASNTDAGDAFGESVSVSGDTLAVGAYGEASNATSANGNQADNSASENGAVYVFRRSGGGWAQEAYLKASNTDAGDMLFGGSVSVSGDTLAVGAPGEASNATPANGNPADNSAHDSGAVYVFRRSGGGWAQEAYLKASNTDEGDIFGGSVSVSGDTLAVGAPYEDSNATAANGNQADNSAHDSGAVYVFRRSGGGWAQEAYLKASNTDAGDMFGKSVSVSGDTLAVGAYGEASNATSANGNQADNSASESGAVYVFRRSGSGWAQEAYLKASNTDADDIFGRSVSVSGDTLAVGAAGEASNATTANGNQVDNSAGFSGAVYVFRRSGSGWAQEAYLKASNPDEGDIFGGSLSVSGDTLAVGAPEEASNATSANGNQADNSAGFSGAVYVFRRSGGGWAQEAYLKASNTDAGDRFGWSVSVSGDTLAVGASGEASNATSANGNQADNSARDSGAVYVFRRSGSGWAQEAYLKASNAEALDNYFGFSVSVSGDTLAVGAYGEASNATTADGNQADNSATWSGAVYVFRRSGGGWAQEAYLKASNPDAFDRFGASVSVSGDTLAVGAPGEGSNATKANGNPADNSARGSGAVYLFQ